MTPFVPFDPSTFHLSVAGGLLDLMHRCQNGDCTCLFAAKAIEAKADELYDEISRLKLAAAAYQNLIKHRY